MTLTATFPAAYNIRPSRATGAEALAIEEQVTHVRTELARTETYGRVLWHLVDTDNHERAAERSVFPHPKSVYYATRFLDRMPFDMITPDAGVDDDGEVALDWVLAPGRRLSLTFSPNGRINYSGLFDGSESYGAEWFDDEIPVDVLHCMRRLLS